MGWFPFARSRFSQENHEVESCPSGSFLLRGPPRPADLSRFYASGGKSWGAIEGHRADSRAASRRVKLPDWGLPCPNFVAQPGKGATGGDEAEYDFVGQRHDEEVASASKVSAGPPVLWRERRDDGQSAILDSAPVLGGKPHRANASGCTQRDRLPAAQQNLQTLPFQWVCLGME